MHLVFAEPVQEFTRLLLGKKEAIGPGGAAAVCFEKTIKGLKVYLFKRLYTHHSEEPALPNQVKIARGRWPHDEKLL
jgi:hypothetical protein